MQWITDTANMVNVEIKYNENNWINTGPAYCEWDSTLISSNFSVIGDLFILLF